MPKESQIGPDLGQRQRIVDPGFSGRNVPGRVHQQRTAAVDLSPVGIRDARMRFEMPLPAPRHRHRRFAVRLPADLVDADVHQQHFAHRHGDRGLGGRRGDRETRNA